MFTTTTSTPSHHPLSSSLCHHRCHRLFLPLLRAPGLHDGHTVCWNAIRALTANQRNKLLATKGKRTSPYNFISKFLSAMIVLYICMSGNSLVGMNYNMP